MKFATWGVQASGSPFGFKPILTLWLVALFGVGAEATGDRFALVIGNGKYQDAPLANARNDAEDIAALLREIGFSVDLAVEVDKADFSERVLSFAERTRGADAALFFYAGHGMQVDKTNYLLPVDAKLRTELGLDHYAVKLEWVLKGMRGAANLVFLDACRNNPFASRLASSMGERGTVGRGLAPVEKRDTHGTYIAFATAEGEIAADGEGKNSPFTAALKKHLPTPGLTVDSVMTRVRDELAAHDQVPWSNTSLRKEFYFVPPNPDPPLKPATESGMDPEEEEWRFVRDSGNPERVRDFLERHPKGRFAGAAQALIEQLSGARFTVETEPPGAGVRLAGHDYRAGMRLPAGLYRVEVTADGHETRTVTVSHGGSPTTQRVVLRKVADCPTCQPFTVRTGPPDARVQIMNIGPRYEPGIKLPPGSYDVRVTARGFDTVELSLRHDDEPTDKWIGLPFRDCPVCPKMVELPKGNYTMGTSKEEDMSRLGKERDRNEGPAHKVEIRYPLAVGVFEVSFEEWDACVEDRGCTRHLWDEGRGRGRRPVVHATLADAKEYANWLTARIGRHYRLLSEAEWEYAARAGTSSGRHWGGRLEDQCAYENGPDVTAQGENSDWTIVDCIDGYVYAAPTDETRFRSNPWGLHHMLGNVSEWTADCWHPNYVAAPTDGSAWTGDCDDALHVVRGGSWRSVPRDVRAPTRSPVDPAESSNHVGFRVAVDVTR